MEFSRNILWEFCLDVRLKCQFQFIKSLSKFYSWATWNCQDFIVFALSKHSRSNQVEVFCKKDVKYFAKLTWKDSFFIKSEGAYFFKKKNLFHRTLTVASSKTSIVPPKSGKQVIHLIFEFKSLIWEWIFESIFCTNRFL